jgi:hypothetical protein
MEKSQGTGIESITLNYMAVLVDGEDAWKNPKERELKANNPNKPNLPPRKSQRP